MAGAFPSASGKTNLAMLIPTLDGLEGRDDRRRHRLDEVRRGRAPLRGQPRGRLLRRRARTRATKTNPNAMATVERNSIFTNCAQTDDGDVWWEGMTDEPPEHAIDWRGNDWTPDSEEPAAHPNARFTTPGGPVPLDRPGVGGPRRRADRRLPVRRPPRDAWCRWSPRRSTGSTACSSARRCRSRRPRRPRARSASSASTRWRCCRSAATTWPTTSATGCAIGARARRPKLPRIFLVNWFRKDEDGNFIWPGFGENSRVLEWIFRRCDGEAEAVETPIGLVPGRGRDQHRGPRVSAEEMERAARRRPASSCAQQLPQVEEHLARFGDRLPDEALSAQLEALDAAGRLSAQFELT